MKTSRKIIIAGGGTGGHIFPAIAIANAIKKLAPETEFLFVGAKGKMEMEKIPQAGFRIKGLEIAGFNRSNMMKNISLPYKLLKSFIEVRSIFREFKPDAVIGVGGYSSFPVLRYAQGKGIRNFIHESNSFAGRTNILLGRRCTAIFTATEGMEKFFPADKIIVTGNPVRESIVNSNISREDALKRFGLEPGLPVILSVGGSLGAKSINEALEKDLDKLGNYQLIWQTGKPFFAQATKKAEGKTGVKVFEFIRDMEYAYAAADLVISRSGAMAIAELCVVQKPVVFVPYPHAAEDHQTANAKKLVNQSAAKMISDSEALSGLVPEVIALASNKEEQEKLRSAIGKLAVRNADVNIAEKIISALR